MNRNPLPTRGAALRVMCSAVVAVLFISSIQAAQATKSSKAGKKDEPAAKAAGKSEGPKKEAAQRGNQDDRSKPQLVDLQTDDGVMIAATYFPPLRPGRDVPAVMLLHGYGEKQSIFFPTETQRDLAFALQDKGYAVLTLDFRGHGHSTRRAGLNNKAADPKQARLDFNELRSANQFLPLLNDIETAKRFLVQKNNAGELNISKLAVIGAEMGASLGMLWAYRDWQFPVQAGFVGKQGQDVIAMVLISPHYNFKGIAITKELTYMQQRVPMQFVVGKKDQKAFNEAEKMYQAARRARPNETDSRLTELNTSVQRGMLLNPDLELEVDKEIATFLDNTLRKRPVKWESREVSDSEKAGS